MANENTLVGTVEPAEYVMGPKFLAISFEEDGTAFKVLPDPVMAYAWLLERRIDELHGSCLIFEFTGEISWMDYDSYGECHLHSTTGEAELVYNEDAMTLNEDKYGLGSRS